MPAPILTRRKRAKCKRVRIPLFLGLFRIVEEDDEEEMGVSFGSSGKGSLSLSVLASILGETCGAPASIEGVRDGFDAECFSSAMVVEMASGKGRGEEAKEPFNELVAQ